MDQRVVCLCICLCDVCRGLAVSGDQIVLAQTVIDDREERLEDTAIHETIIVGLYDRKESKRSMGEVRRPGKDLFPQPNGKDKAAVKGVFRRYQ